MKKKHGSFEIYKAGYHDGSYLLRRKKKIRKFSNLLWIVSVTLK